ncbi:GL23177 [Drosophila persimilis]|uniref:GL23177 n=1 Tax=Drosophila persimilis TaxID=7234 RepID=B4G5F4_DROPE|nr:uncharacterized protein LOC6588422 [Drosophila persimilis]EDW24820.1 GL23177 [Drosophila persimilis]
MPIKCRSSQAIGLGDFEEDPRTRGILHNTSCRAFRERLRSTRKFYLFQGLAIATGGVALLGVLIVIGMDVAADDSNAPGTISQMKALLDKVLKLLADGMSFGFSATGQYCNQPLDTKRLFELINKQVLNQEQALAGMERTLSRDHQFQSMALLGPPGVGKTLTVSALRLYFPWPENVHALFGSSCGPDEERHCPVIRKILEQLSDCGKNLLIIDNLAPCDHSIVAIFNRQILNGLQNKSVLVLYIFNLEVKDYWRQFEFLQKELPVDTGIVSFRLFGRDDLRDCLQNELKLGSRVLDEDEQSRILGEAMSRVCCAGCKGLREIVLQQGRSETDETCTI